MSGSSTVNKGLTQGADAGSGGSWARVEAGICLGFSENLKLLAHTLLLRGSPGNQPGSGSGSSPPLPGTTRSAVTHTPRAAAGIAHADTHHLQLNVKAANEFLVILLLKLLSYGHLKSLVTTPLYQS